MSRSFADVADVADVADARAALLRQFRWDNGHADVWAVFRDAGAFAAVLRGLIAPFRDAGITAVAGIESRGFLLGGACAAQLGVGFVPIRKSGTFVSRRETAWPDRP